MKTTIDLPNRLLDQTKIEAVRRRTTIKNLVIEGLEMVLKNGRNDPDPSGALARSGRATTSAEAPLQAGRGDPASVAPN